MPPGLVKHGRTDRAYWASAQLLWRQRCYVSCPGQGESAIGLGRGPGLPLGTRTELGEHRGLSCRFKVCICWHSVTSACFLHPASAGPLGVWGHTAARSGRGGFLSQLPLQREGAPGHPVPQGGRLTLPHPKVGITVALSIQKVFGMYLLLAKPLAAGEKADTWGISSVSQDFLCS